MPRDPRPYGIDPATRVPDEIADLRRRLGGHGRAGMMQVGIDVSELQEEVAAKIDEEELTAAIDAHEGAPDPHPQYATDDDVELVEDALIGHVGAADPHGQYQLESEKAQPGGFAPLDETGKVPLIHLPDLDPTPAFDTTLGAPNRNKHVEVLPAGLLEHVVEHDLQTNRYRVGLYDTVTEEWQLTTYEPIDENSFRLTFAVATVADRFKVIVTRDDPGTRRYQAPYAGASPISIPHNLGTDEVVPEARNAAGELVFPTFVRVDEDTIEAIDLTGPVGNALFVTVTG